MKELDWARYGLVDPRASVQSAGDPVGQVSFDLEASGLADVPIEFLWNGKSNGDILLSGLERWLTEHAGITSLGQTAKLLPNTTAPQELIIDLAARARMVVTGPGD